MLDVGAGSGYFVGALAKCGIPSRGIEISKEQVSYGNLMLGKALLKAVKNEDILQEIASCNESIVSFIGVLEHLVDFHEPLKCIAQNPNIHYIFFSVPLFCFTCLLEAINPQIFNRHLGGGHTHLFSKQSLDYMYRKYNMAPVAVWDFGSDIMDLRRHMLINLSNQNTNVKILNIIESFFANNSDSLQTIIDKSSFASETHVLVKIER